MAINPITIENQLLKAALHEIAEKCDNEGVEDEQIGAIAKRALRQTKEGKKQELNDRTQRAIVGLSEDAASLVATAYQLIFRELEPEGENAVWIERGMTLFRAVAQAFCYEQFSNGNNHWTASNFLDSMSLESVERLYMNGYKHSLSNNGKWPDGYSLIKDYLDTFLPAYDTGILLAQHGEIDLNHAFKYNRKFSDISDLKQRPTADEKHQYFTMTLKPALKHFRGHLYRNKIRLT